LSKLENDRKNRNVLGLGRQEEEGGGGGGVEEESSASSGLKDLPVVSPAEIEAVVAEFTDRNQKNGSFCVYFFSVFCPCIKGF